MSVVHAPLTNISNETSASVILENQEEMFPRYYVDGDAIRRFRLSNTRRRATRREMIEPVFNFELEEYFALYSCSYIFFIYVHQSIIVLFK